MGPVLSYKNYINLSSPILERQINPFYHDELSPIFWTKKTKGDDITWEFDQRVRKKLLRIADDFFKKFDEILKEKDIVDIQLTGSLANFNYTGLSDLDVHVIVNLEGVDDDNPQILKSALDSYETRTISWMAKMNKNDEYPQQFDFTGRIIFISNKSKTSIDGAILSRSLTVDLTMTPDEKIERMTTILPNILPEYDDEVKAEALNFLNENKGSASINMRTLIMVIKMRFSNPDNWMDMASYMLNS